MQALRSQVLNFEFLEDIQDSLFESWIGFNKNQFLSILNSISINCKMPSTVLALYLAKIHTGEINERLACG